MKHPNKLTFVGVLAKLDVPSDKAPYGARGHRVILTSRAAKDALTSLIGMGINMSAAGDGHNAAGKIGVIDSAEVTGNEITVSGYIWAKDCHSQVRSIQASAEDWGMSYELSDAHVEDMRSETWKVTKATFTGAAVLLRDKAAYKSTHFIFVD